MRREHLCVAAVCGFSFHDVTVQQECEDLAGNVRWCRPFLWMNYGLPFVPLDMSPGLRFGIQLHGLENYFLSN